jgi:NAD(P)H-dependent flavin oxidoreductase YrpB (nitropropane dioxygenase family)
MPLQGLLFGEASARWSRVHSKDFAGHPAGQILGTINRVRPSKDIVLDMVSEWIETMERLNGLMDAEASA